MAKDTTYNKELSSFNRGIYTDANPNNQPKGTYRFALNAVIETDDGDNNILSNEESNEIFGNLKPGYIPIGKVYANNNRVIIFLVNSTNSISEIGIYDANIGKYTTHVNDELSSDKDKLKFSVNRQIKAIYRLRRGCEDTVYFVDKNRPKYFNFFKGSQFKKQNGTWVASKFNLQRTYDLIPNFSQINVLDSGGNIAPGSYNISIQYVDESLNPTEWIISSPVVRVMNDISTKDYGEINGSTKSDIEYLNFPNTGKSIEIKLSNLDTNFLYYRLAIIAANAGTGLINQIVYTETIPITKNFFIYTGSNHVETGTLEEIAQFTDIISKASTIEQIENRLIIGNTEGVQGDMCKLQRFASRIKADCIVKKVVLNDINDPSNTKNPSHELNNSLGYMPGEIYSYGIIYILEGNVLSPVFHIPGKNEQDKEIVFSPSKDSEGNVITFPMAINNKGVSTYTENDSCGKNNYWGLDYNGVPLINKQIRHHRFPLRSEIKMPLINTDFGENQTTEYYNLRATIKGNIKVPIPCPETNPNCGTDKFTVFNVRVDYTVNSEDFFFIETIDPSEFSNNTNNSYEIELFEDSNYHSTNNFENIRVSVSDVNDVYQNFDTWITADGSEKCKVVPDYFASGNMCVKISSEIYNSNTQSKIVTGNILGIKFSNIEKPTSDMTGGLDVIGYYIVRNERTEFEKTIIDSGVLVPTVYNNKYISHGLLQPETNAINKSVYGIIHPEHKFNDKEYLIYDKLIQEGNYKIVERKYGKINYDDVYDGTSYNSKYHKAGNDDGHEKDGSPTSRGLDGWSLNIISRDNIVNFESKSSFTINKNDIKDRFYLDALGYKSINDNKNDVYNIACDNKIGMIQFNETVSITDNLPYVVMYKDNFDPYSNFRILPYYRETTNPIYFSSDVSERAVFNGDTYISPMRYTNTIYWDNRIADRQGKKSLLKIVLGVLVIVAGAVLAFATGGAGTLVVGAGIALIGAGALYASSGIKMDNYNRAYSEEYNKGLRQTTLDNWVDAFYNYKDNQYTNPGGGIFGFIGNGRSGSSGPSDDTIQWINECITDLWFESTINTNLRNKFVDDVTPTFLNSPWRVESGNDTPIGTWEFFGKYYTNSNAQRYPISSLENHGARKLLAFDEQRDDNRLYTGVALGEYYNINPDYNRRNKEKIYYHLPIEYDCCSECQEKFPHRWYWSQQSFQEELSDNYRVFLPNNYRDLEGETGEIINIFRLKNDLFIHTKEALWQAPRNHQERVTDQVVSFIGTGEYFSIPPIPIIDDETGNSAGCSHMWSYLKTTHGVFFVSENQNKIYQFTGSNLVDITNKGLNSWFKNNIKSKMDEHYRSIKNGEEYPYNDNPSNKYGTGFITTYDSRKERIIITKKDFINSNNIFDNDDFEICNSNGQLNIFYNISETIEEQKALGWTYVGIENCRLKFEKEVIKTRTEIRETIINVDVPNNADIIVQLDMSGSFNSVSRNQIKVAVSSWLLNFANQNEQWEGNLYFCEHDSWVMSQRSWRTFRFIKDGTRIFNTSGASVPASAISKDVIAVSFVNENAIEIGQGAANSYHRNNIKNPADAPLEGYIIDYNDFIQLYNSHISNGGSFRGLVYPIVYSSGNSSSSYTEAYLQHTMAALKGRPYTEDEFNQITPNAFTDKWNILKDSLINLNNYPTDGLENYNWKGIFNRGWSGSGDVITAAQFQIDMDEFLKGSSTVVREEFEIEVPYIEMEYNYIDGEVIENFETYNNSWTLSYSLKGSNDYFNWISFHSYLPSFYINTPEEFFSWDYSSNNIWKHNKHGDYQNFYGSKKPFIIDLISNSSLVTTKFFETFSLSLVTKKYDNDLKEYYIVDNTFFNKVIFYNSRETTGLKNIIIENKEDVYSMTNSIKDTDNITAIKDYDDIWNINNIRDYRINYNIPIFNSNIVSLQNNYFIDKILNENSIDINKDWKQLSVLKDTYLGVRLYYDDTNNTKLLFNYSIELENNV